MNQVIETLSKYELDIDSLLPFLSNGFFKTLLKDEDDIIDINCSFIIGFYSTESVCEFDLVVECFDTSRIIFHYNIGKNQLFYAINDKFIIPCIKLYRSKIYIKNFLGNPSDLYIIKNNISAEDTLSLIPRLLYCVLDKDNYLIYDEGICHVKSSLLLDRQTSLYSEIKNIKVCKFIKNQDMITYVTSYKEVENDNYLLINKIKSMNFFKSMYVFLFG